MILLDHLSHLFYNDSMKLNSLRAFQKHLEGAVQSHMPPVYLITSEEGSENRLAASMLVDVVAKKDKLDAMSFRHVYASRMNARELDAELKSRSFFTDKIYLHVLEVEQLNKEAEGKLVALIKEMPADLFLILSGQGLGKTQSFVKEVEKRGVVVDLDGEKSWEKEKSADEWLRQEAAKERKVFEGQASQYLVKGVGADLSLLKQELEKLMIYTHGRPKIRVDDVQAVCVRCPKETIWGLAEAILKREGAQAIAIFRNLLDEGQSFFSLIKQLRQQIQTDFQIASILRSGGGAEDVQRVFPYMKGFILDRHLEMARGYGFQRFKKAIVIIDDHELKAKDGFTNVELLADLLTMRLTA